MNNLIVSIGQKDDHVSLEDIKKDSGKKIYIKSLCPDFKLEDLLKCVNK
jgi:hypothetical protein